MTFRLTESDLAEIQARRSAWNKPAKQVLSSLTLPLRLPSLANQRVHPLKRWRQGKQQKSAVASALTPYLKPALPVVVTLTRIGPRKLDSDNLAISFKSVRDQLAAWIGVDDGSDLYVWQYEQEKAKEYGIRIEIKSR